MKSILFTSVLIVFVAVLLQNCKSDRNDNNANSSNDESYMSKESRDNLNEMEKAVAAIGQGKGEVVDFRKLKEALPEKLAGLKRTSHTGQKSGFASIQVSTAQANYADGDKSLDVTITDTGGFGMAMAGLAAWSSIEMDSETETGYEKTSVINGHKAYEKFDKSTQNSEISVIYKDRFIISLSGHNVPMDDMHDAVKKIDIKV